MAQQWRTRANNTLFCAVICLSIQGLASKDQAGVSWWAGEWVNEGASPGTFNLSGLFLLIAKLVTLFPPAGDLLANC